MTDDLRFDLDLQKKDVLDLSSPDGVAAFFTRLRYDISARTLHTATSLGISEAVARPIQRIELIADRDLFQVYLVELTSVTVEATRALVRSFRDRGGDFLFVFTSGDYGRLDFVFLDRLAENFSSTTIGSATVAVRPRILTVDRRNPSTIALRVLRRFTWTEPDRFAQSDKIRSAYAVAEWSEEEGLFNNRALFSDHYLKSRLRDDEVWRDDGSAVAFRELRNLLVARSTSGKTDEDSLRDSFFGPVFKILGFSAPKVRRDPHNVELPDFELRESKESEKPLARCLTYPWMRFLDGKDSARDAETPDENPGAVVVSLLQNSETPWVVVTNGKLWRLYSKRTHSRATSYFEVDLEEVVAEATRASTDPFRYFWLLFRRQAFEQVTFTREGREETFPFLDRLLLESEDYAKDLGERLKERVFDRVFPHLAEGFVSQWEGPPSEEDLQLTYRATLTLLYRLLFLLYAESRDLLPVREVRGYYEKSLARLKKEIAEAAGSLEDEIETKLKKAMDGDSMVLYQRLNELFAIIDTGSVDLNVPFYNGGLFATSPSDDDDSDEAETARFLRDHAVPDQHLAAAIDLLSREDDPRLGRIFIDYKSLGVRHLGSIYEGLLEFRIRFATERLGIVREKSRDVYTPWRELDEKRKAKLERDGRFVKRGQMYLENDKHERKATGSYYTPDYIVKYIVERAVGPVVKEKLEGLRPRFRDAQRWRTMALAQSRAKGETVDRNYDYGPTVERAWSQLIDDAFGIKVLDPAMGSGHFLVEAVDFITDHVLDFLNAFPWNPVTAHLRYTREQILKSMEEQKVSIDPGKLTDVNLLKRHVLKRCIYGVDLNPMAVELAKVSLWLDCFTLGAPLSFLDHHLRCGNSLVGVTVEEVDAKLREGTQANLFSGNKFAGVKTSVAGMIAIGEQPDITPDQVKDSRSEYKRASSAIDWAKRLLDVYTSQWFGNHVVRGTRGRGDVNPALEFLGDKTSEVWAGSPASSKVTDHFKAVVLAAESAGSEYRFFHWQLEFPEVFLAGGASMGFDAVLGNPPYDVLASGELERDVSQLLAFFESEPAYTEALGGKKNLYKLFIVRASALRTSTNGTLGFIVPMALLGDDQAVGPRKLLLADGLPAIEAFPQKDDPKRRVFPEAKLSTAAFVAQSGNSTEIRVRTHPGRYIEESSPVLSLTSEQLQIFDPGNLAIPSCTQQDWNLALSVLAIPDMQRMGVIAKSYQGEVNETNERPHGVFADDLSLPLALRGANITLYSVREASQGEQLQVDVKRFLRDKGQGSKAFHYRLRRIGFQRSAPQNNFRRLIAAPIPRDQFCLDTVSYVTAESSAIDLRLLLAVLNSDFLDWFFRLTSTNSKVNEYQFDLLPVPTFEPSIAGEPVDFANMDVTNAIAQIKPGCVPARVTSLLLHSIDQIVSMEANRIMGRRSERAHLGEDSQSVQDFVNATLYAAYGLTTAEADYVSRRREEML